MEASLSKTRWGRVLIAAVAVHLLNVAIAVLATIVFALVAVGPQGAAGGIAVDRFAAVAGVWGVPV
jgi:hypothetical protein